MSKERVRCWAGAWKLYKAKLFKFQLVLLC